MTFVHMDNPTQVLSAACVGMGAQEHIREEKRKRGISTYTCFTVKTYFYSVDAVMILSETC